MEIDESYQQICQLNPTYQIKPITDPSFKQYGVIWENYDLTEVKNFAHNHFTIPSGPNVYVPSNPELEKCALFGELSRDIYAFMPLEAGQCMGHTSDFTAVEYHQGSEVNITLTDVIMVLAHRAILEEKDSIDAQKEADLFYVPAGTVFEMYSDTLHYSPIMVHDSGFKVIVVLPKGSNQPLKYGLKTHNPRIVKQNKFQLVHKCRTDKIAQGAIIGVTGDLIKITPLKED